MIIRSRSSQSSVSRRFSTDPNKAQYKFLAEWIDINIKQLNKLDPIVDNSSNSLTRKFEVSLNKKLYQILLDEIVDADLLFNKSDYHKAEDTKLIDYKIIGGYDLGRKANIKVEVFDKRRSYVIMKMIIDDDSFDHLMEIFS